MNNPFELLFRDSPMLLAALDDSLICRDASDAWRDRLGLAPGKEIAIPVAELFDHENATTVLDQIEKVARNATMLRGTPVSLKTKDHAARKDQGLLSAWCVKQDHDERPWILLAVNDTAEIKQALNELSQLQTAHQLILDSAGEGIYGVDCQGRTTFVNTAATKILGWRSDDVLGQPLHDIHHHSHPDGSPYARDDCPIYAAFKDGEVHRVDSEVFWHTNGTSVPVEYMSTPILQDGKLSGAVVVFKDISERKEAENRLRKSEERYRKLFDYSGDGIFLVDPAQGKILDVNPKSCDMLGYSRQELLAMQISDLHPNEMPKFQAFAQFVISQGHGQTDQLSCLTKTGQSMPIEISAAIFFDNDDEERQHMLVSLRDISERKKNERQRKEAYEEIKYLKEQLELERDYLRDEINVTINFGEIIGESQALKRTLSQIEAVAVTPANVLVLGESGVGKEMVARAIHAHSPRADKSLVKVNCASIPKDLFESEFFGHVRGAFTSAHRDRIGRLQLADGGTLFLDEVGEIPLALQGKLLRALQEHEFERVGDDKTIKVDVRIVAATNRDLAAEVKAGRFREDLFYRLSVFPIEVPPLRERMDDIGPLAAQFLECSCRELGRDPLKLTQQQISILTRHSWPGNIRELKNVIERAVILTKGNRLRLDLAMPSELQAKSVSDTTPLDTSEFLTDEAFRSREKANMVAALRYANWRISGTDGAAELLGVKPSTLTYRMKVFGIKSRNESH